MSSCVFTAWFTVTGFHFSIWANLYTNIGHVDLTSLAARRSIAMPSSVFFSMEFVYSLSDCTCPQWGWGTSLQGLWGYYSWLSAGGGGLRGVVKAAGECVAAFCGWGLAENAPSIYRPKPDPLSLVLISLTLLTPHYCRFPSLKMMCIWCLWYHFLLSFLCYLNCYSPSSALHTKPINFPLQKGNTLSP